MKKFKKICLVFVVLFLLTGCTKNLKDSNNKVVTNPETGQSLTANIVCQPTNQSLLKIYKENKVDVSKLPSCKSFPISDGYEGLWNSVFVRPLAWLILKIGSFVKSYALSLIIITLLIRIVCFPLFQKTAMQSENMKKAQPELNRLENKYKEKTTQADQTAKASEMMQIYKKYSINPVMGCVTSFIQLPIFFAFLEAINRVPAIFEETLFKSTIFELQLGTTPLFALKSGSYQVLILNVLIILVTYFSFKFTSADVQQAKQTKIMSIFMVVFIGFMSFSLPAAIAIYWIFSSAFTVGQNLFAKLRSKKNGK